MFGLGKKKVESGSPNPEVMPRRGDVRIEIDKLGAFKEGQSVELRSIVRMDEPVAGETVRILGSETGRTSDLKILGEAIIETVIEKTENSAGNGYTSSFTIKKTE